MTANEKVQDAGLKWVTAGVVCVQPVVIILFIDMARGTILKGFWPGEVEIMSGSIAAGFLCMIIGVIKIVLAEKHCTHPKIQTIISHKCESCGTVLDTQAAFDTEAGRKKNERRLSSG